jgi:Glycosyl hydrolases family 2, sugar binding domain.
VLLNLGQVESLATVRVNDKEFPTLWAYPYQVDISSALKNGKNKLTVEVVNSWYNRLVGDAGLPAEKRQTKVTHDPFKQSDVLQPSGLIGPVRLIEIK